MKWRIALFGALMLVLTVLGIAYGTGTSRSGQVIQGGNVVSLGYRPARTNTFYRAGLSGTDGTNAVDIAAIETAYCGGWASVAVTGIHSTASATCVIHILRCAFDGTTLWVKSMSTATLTAGARYTNGGSGNFLSLNSAGFDTEGADLIKIVVEAPSAGTIGLNVEIY